MPLAQTKLRTGRSVQFLVGMSLYLFLCTIGQAGFRVEFTFINIHVNTH